MVYKVNVVYKAFPEMYKVFKVKLVQANKVHKVFLVLLVYKDPLDQNFKVFKVKLVQRRVSLVNKVMKDHRVLKDL